MSLIGNIIWIIFGGLLESLAWLFAGIVCCITIVGIPLGKQCFKFSSLSLAPFGRDIIYGGGSMSLIANALWLVFFGIHLTFFNLILGCIFYITIIGIPFGKQFFKLAKLSFMPFGAMIV